MVGDIHRRSTSPISPIPSILLRYFEALGRVRRAMSVMKKRGGSHEDTIREFKIGSRGISVGEPLDNFQGVLHGSEPSSGTQRTLMGDP